MRYPEMTKLKASNILIKTLKKEHITINQRLFLVEFLISVVLVNEENPDINIVLRDTKITQLIVSDESSPKNHVPNSRSVLVVIANKNNGPNLWLNQVFIGAKRIVPNVKLIG